MKCAKSTIRERVYPTGNDSVSIISGIEILPCLGGSEFVVTFVLYGDDKIPETPEIESAKTKVAQSLIELLSLIEENRLPREILHPEATCLNCRHARDFTKLRSVQDGKSPLLVKCRESAYTYSVSHAEVCLHWQSKDDLMSEEDAGVN